MNTFELCCIKRLFNFAYENVRVGRALHFNITSGVACDKGHCMEQGERRFPLLNSPTGLDTQVPVIVHTLLKKCPKISAIDILFKSLNITTRQLGHFFLVFLPCVFI